MGSDAKWWISAIASCALRFGRNPYEHGWKSASKMGSSTSFRLAWTTRSAMVGTVTSYCPSCSRVLGGFGFLRSALATGPRCCRHYASGHRHPRTAASPARPGLAGRRVEVAGLLDPGAASGLDLVVPRDVQPAGLAAAGGELTGADPVVDDMNAAAEPVGGFGDADLAVGSRRGGRGQRARARGAAQAGGLGDQFLAAGADLVVPGDAG